MGTQHNPPPPLSDGQFLFDDWFAAYGPDATTGMVPPGCLSMAEALHRTCEGLLVSYDRDFPLLATLPSLPLIARELAFVGDVPVPEVHDRYAPTMRAVDAFVTLAEGSLLSQNDHVWRTVGSDRFADPHPLRDWDGFVAVFGSTAHLHSADWDHLLIEVGGWRSIGMMARRVLTAAAEVLAPLFAHGTVRTFAIPREGRVEVEPIATDHWKTTAVFGRLATGSYDPARPFHQAVASTHRIFVDERSLAEALTDPCRAKEIDPVPHIAPEGDGRAYPYADLLRDLVTDMALLLAQDEHRSWRSMHLRMALSGMDPRWRNIDDGLFRKARETLYGLGIEGLEKWQDGRPSNEERAVVEGLRKRKFDRGILIRGVSNDILRKLPQSS